MGTHDEILELIPAYALDALDEQEAARVKAHLPNCSQCRRALEDYRRVGEGLARAVAQVDPPRTLQARTLRPLAGSWSFQAREQPRITSRLRGNWRGIFTGLALAFALVALSLTLWQNDQMGREFAAQRELVAVLAYADGTARTIHGTTAAPRARGKLYAEPDSTVAALITVNMPPLAPDETYAVSLVQSDGQKTDVGTFRVDLQGNGLLLLRAPLRLDAYRTIMVTRLRGAGLALGEGEVVLEAELNIP